MNGKNFSEVVELIVQEDPRYGKGAYTFVRKALDHTIKQMRKEGSTAPNQHVSGRQLCEGIRDYALEQYGPMAMKLLRDWGVRECIDFGEIVFNLVDYEVFGTTPEDSREDFAGHYDFEEAFVEPFKPVHGSPRVHFPVREMMDTE